MRTATHRQPMLEQLESRLVFSAFVFPWPEGVLTISPPNTQASPPPIQINRQIDKIVLPDGQVKVLENGLRTAQGNTPVVTYTLP